ncbi:MAG: B12-binding domain-containing radical SAM protein, partial [Rhodanobacteraceae bacterium]
MIRSPNTLLINPTVTTHPRFPLSLLNLAAALDHFGDSRIVDGNIDRDLVSATLAAARERHYDAIGIGIMGGPQVAPAIAVSKAIREQHPSMSIIWGGYFPTLYTDTTLAAPYVDYVVRGQGEESLAELVSALGRGGGDEALAGIGGLSWRRDGEIVHNPNRKFHHGDVAPMLLPYGKLGDLEKYLGSTFLGRRTAVHQASIGCRFRCTFCGVAAMFGGATALPPTARLERELNYLKYELGADSILFYDHNFFDREQDMIPMLEVMARFEMPWWCFARADALLKLSESTWKLVRKSRLRMAYIGAESPSGAMLKEIRKGTRPDQTLAVAELCARHGVIPEFSFMLA